MNYLCSSEEEKNTIVEQLKKKKIKYKIIRNNEILFIGQGKIKYIIKAYQ